MNDPAHFDFDVLIAGCGPVGAGAAILLARAGLRVGIFDRSTTVYDLPRAVLLDGETLRAFQRVGLAEPIDAVLQPHREGDAAQFTDSKRRTLFGLDMPPTGSNGWRDGAFFDQPEFEARLRELMLAEPLVTARFGHEITGLEQDGDVVAVQATDLESGRSIVERARYLLGCDGASSFVRRHLGIEWRSLGYDHDWLVVDILVDDCALLPPVTMQVCDPARLTTYVCGKDPFRRWEFRLLPGETRDEMLEPARLRSLLDPWVDAAHYELRRAAVYQFHAAIAAQWRSGRVFLAGDAAHQTPPFLGQGMNAGFRDAVNLSWKLALVLAGDAPASLLDSYEPERDVHAHELVDWAVAVGRLMDALADAEAGRATGPPPDDLLRSGYGQGRAAPPLRRGIVIEAQVSDAGFTGYMLGQPTVAANDGAPVLLDEILGPGFAVVGRDAAALAMSDASRRWLDSAGARVVDLSALEIVRGHRDRLFDSHAAAVVRPDRYVFGVTDTEHSLDDLVAALAVATGIASADAGNRGHEPRAGERRNHTAAIGSPGNVHLSPISTNTAGGNRMSEPVVRIRDIAWIRLRVPDLDRMEEYLLDFGMERSARTDSALYMRGSSSSHHLHVSEKGEKAGLVGFAFVAACAEDLDRLAAVAGASPVHDIDEPGGGRRVVIDDPWGTRIELVYGVQPVDPLPASDSGGFNLGGRVERRGAVKRVGKKATVMRLGHAGINVGDPDAAYDWYHAHFGILKSDSIAMGDFTLAHFCRCDRGSEHTDHHSFLLARAMDGQISFNHVSYEVGDLDDVWTGHQYLAERGYRHSWGIGRHTLGSQIFDYWRDPWGQIHEHYTDGDLLDAAHVGGVHPLGEGGSQWGPEMPHDFGQTIP